MNPKFVECRPSSDICKGLGSLLFLLLKSMNICYRAPIFEMEAPQRTFLCLYAHTHTHSLSLSLSSSFRRWRGLHPHSEHCLTRGLAPQRSKKSPMPGPHTSKSATHTHTLSLSVAVSLVLFRLQTDFLLTCK